MESILALTPQNNEAFQREVDEALRRDQMTKLGRRYGIVAVIAVVAGLLAFAGYLYWQNQQTLAAGGRAEQFAKVIDDLGAGDRVGASAALENLAKSDSPGYRASARMTQADILLERNDLKGAAAKFAEMASDESLAQPFRDLALIRQTAAEYDTLAPQAVVTRLQNLAKPGNPWFGSAGEMVAVAHLKMNKPELAGPLFRDIAAQETMPPSIRSRAVQMAGLLGVDAVDQSEEKNAQ